ncbi:MAG: 30S ribosomal protein S8 [Candidatus Magasanikbacteria bacterium]|nr:30S ribosomal protein S8 [Candidatus Magasanikbacteria bacterium]
MMTDPIADMLTRIRNAVGVKKSAVTIPYSKLKKSIGEILVREGYVAKIEEAKTPSHVLVVTLKYNGPSGAVQSLKRISRPGSRRYVKKDDIERVLNGLGLAILSTPRGVMTDSDAIKAGVGGELLCEIY